MKTYTIWQVAEASGATKTQIDKWISRGLFTPSQSVPEKQAREYTFDDVVYLAAIVSLRKFGMGVKRAALLVDATLASADAMAPAMKGSTGIYVNIENVRRHTKTLLKKVVGQDG